MSRFHNPRRGWLPQLFDGLKLILLGVFLIGYLAVVFQPPSTQYKTYFPAELEGMQEDSASLSSNPEGQK